MAERINQPTPLSAEEVLRTEIIVNQALIDILIAKQIISEEELVHFIRKIRTEQIEMLKNSDELVSFKKNRI